MTVRASTYTKSQLEDLEERHLTVSFFILKYKQFVVMPERVREKHSIIWRVLSQFPKGI